MATEKGIDRIVQVHVRGVRALEDVRLDLQGLTVLIGENGSGKSSLLEALELLRKAAIPGRFIEEQLPQHGFNELLRDGATEVELGVRIEGGGQPIEYAFTVSDDRGPRIVRERLDLFADLGKPEPLHVIQRTRARSTAVALAPSGELTRIDFSAQAEELILAVAWPAPQPAVKRVLSALQRIRIHFAADVEAVWLARERKRRHPIREPSEITRVADLERFGDNLASCYNRLKQSHEAWVPVLDKVRAGLGLDLIDVELEPAHRGHINLQVRFAGIKNPVPASALSDGQLAYLAFVALTELGKGSSLVAFDEPETHLHPGLLSRIVDLMEILGDSCPTLLTTHSDGLLDSLSEAAASRVVLSRLDENRAAHFYRAEPEMLKTWLAEYRGVGSLRAAGLERQVLSQEQLPSRDG